MGDDGDIVMLVGDYDVNFFQDDVLFFVVGEDEDDDLEFVDVWEYFLFVMDDGGMMEGVGMMVLFGGDIMNLMGVFGIIFVMLIRRV